MVAPKDLDLYLDLLRKLFLALPISGNAPPPRLGVARDIFQELSARDF
jgi:hypothetical protein